MFGEQIWMQMKMQIEWSVPILSQIYWQIMANISMQIWSELVFGNAMWMQMLQKSKTSQFEAALWMHAIVCSCSWVWWPATDQVSALSTDFVTLTLNLVYLDRSVERVLPCLWYANFYTILLILCTFIAPARNCGNMQHTPGSVV